MEKNNDFNMEDYINERMMEIKQLDERVLYKEIVGELIKKLYNYSDKAYRELEERILSEDSPRQSDYAIYLTLTDLAHYDATDNFMYPMLESDTKKRDILYEDVVNALKNREMLKMYTVFFQTSASSMYRILQEERKFHGIIKTENREYKGTFVLRRNKDYLDKIKDLYYIFSANYKPWTTVCEAYLMKILDVYLESVEDMKKKEKIVEIKVDFEEYNNVAKYDIIPLWNLKQIYEKTSTYPDPSIDKINYEHQIFSHRLEVESEYLVMNTDIEITNIRRQNGDLFITCPIDRPQEWSLYQVNRKRKNEKYLYPILSNQYKESFSGNITEMYRRSIKTKAEMARLIESYPYNKYLEFQGYEICENCDDEWEVNNYNMDGFIQDEIRVGNCRQTLIVYFSSEDQECYLNEDIMSFLVTQVQKIFPEYLCIGKLT